MALHVAEIERIDHENDAFAAASYVARLPRKYKLHDIAFIAWAPPYEHLPPNTLLEQLIPGFRPVFASDDFLVQWRAAEAGVGAIFLGKAPNRFGQLTGLKPLGLDLGPHSRSSLHLVAAKSALDVPRVRAVAELLREELKGTSK